MRGVPWTTMNTILTRFPFRLTKNKTNDLTRCAFFS